MMLSWPSREQTPGSNTLHWLIRPSNRTPQPGISLKSPRIDACLSGSLLAMSVVVGLGMNSDAKRVLKL